MQLNQRFRIHEVRYTESPTAPISLRLSGGIEKHEAFFNVDPAALGRLGLKIGKKSVGKVLDCIFVMSPKPKAENPEFLRIAKIQTITEARPYEMPDVKPFKHTAHLILAATPSEQLCPLPCPYYSCVLRPTESELLKVCHKLDREKMGLVLGHVCVLI